MQSSKIQPLPLIFHLPALRIKITIMIPRHKNLLPMRQASHPIDLLLNLLYRPRIRQIACVDQDIAVGDVWCVCVGVGYTDYADFGLVAGRLEGCAAEGEEEGVEEGD